VSEYKHTEHLLDEIQRLREANYQLREGAEEQKQRIKRLEEENDAMRADLLLWQDTTDAMCSKAGIGFTTEDKP
jgi:FtsZ-binding cell division protein ZapB